MIGNQSAAVPENYTHPATTGWEGGAVTPYRNGTHYGYVFETRWETERDARQFHGAYLDMLSRRGAREVGDGVYRIPEGKPFADAFRVVRQDETVVVTNAPTIGGLDGVHRPRANATTGG